MGMGSRQSVESRRLEKKEKRKVQDEESERKRGNRAKMYRESMTEQTDCPSNDNYDDRDVITGIDGDHVRDNEESGPSPY